MSTYLQNERGWQMSEGQLKKVLGVPQKLPHDFYITSLDAVQVGDTLVYVLSSAAAWVCGFHHVRGRPHRVMAICPGCSKHVPAGRLHQHRKQTKGHA